MEKLERKHHDHKFTEWLKNIIFGLVMLAPMLAIAVRCGYVMWNKNAKDSYSGLNSSAYEDINISDFNNLKVGETYIFTSSNTQTINANNTKRIYFTDLNIISCTSSSFKDNFVNCNSFTTTFYSPSAFLVPYDDNQSYNPLDMGQQSIIFSFKLTNQIHTNNSYNEQWDTFLSRRIYNDYATLDNAFSYGVSQLSNDPIFNWTRNTRIYQPINAMVSGLEIENDTLQIMLAYWSLMTAVYIVFDLIIFCFTKITHFING